MLTEINPNAALFATQASPKVSKHYNMMPTIDLVNRCRDYGYDIFRYDEKASRKPENKGFAKHFNVPS